MLSSLTLFNIIHEIEQAVPADARESLSVGVAAPPDEDGLAHDMVFRYESPET
jgi:hypothetical protein